MNRRAAGLVALVVAGLALLGFGTGRGMFFLPDASDPPIPLFPEPTLSPGPSPPPPRLADDTGADWLLPGWVVLVVKALVVAALLVVVAAALYAFVRGLLGLRWLVLRLVRARVPTDDYVDAGIEEDAPTELRSRLRRGVAEGYADLDAAPTAAEAVIACWLRLLGAARDAGTAPVAAETPEELVVRVLGDHDVPAPSLRRLAALYEQARFSPHPVDDGMRADARRCLDEVAAGLAGAVPR